MRISDWSSDVCSSDLDFAELRAPADGIISKRLVQPGQVVAAGTELLRLIRDGRLEWRAELSADDLALVEPGATVQLPSREGTVTGRIRAVSPGVDSQARTGTIHADLRSEEHTSELQSLMRISYAVFCLKKKTQKTTN